MIVSCGDSCQGADNRQGGNRAPALVDTQISHGRAGPCSQVLTIALPLYQHSHCARYASIIDQSRCMPRQGVKPLRDWITVGLGTHFHSARMPRGRYPDGHCQYSSRVIRGTKICMKSIVTGMVDANECLAQKASPSSPDAYLHNAPAKNDQAVATLLRIKILSDQSSVP